MPMFLSDMTFGAQANGRGLERNQRMRKLLMDRILDPKS